MKRKPTVPAEYLKLLKEYEKEQSQKVIKKRKSQQPPKPPSPPPQESDSDIEFEDVHLDSNLEENSQPNLESEDDSPLPNELTVSIPQKLTKTTKTANKSVPKPMRLIMHKLYLIAWMVFAQWRNFFTLNVTCSNILKIFLPDSVMAQLKPPDHLTQFLKSKQFVDGLRNAMVMFADNFSLKTNSYLESEDQFVHEISNFKGSKETLGIGFVCLMRSIGLRARLVCSLQPPDNLNSNSSSPDYLKSKAPVFFAEVFDPFSMKWASVDPLTSTLRLPNRSKMRLPIEPTLSDHNNVMRYCIAFDEKHFARDVTKRYASNFNSRTRKRRLEYVDPQGDLFINTLMRYFAKFKLTNEDQNEIQELLRYPKMEGIPQRMQDFIGHPEYAIKEQLHHNEVLKPNAKPSGIFSPKNKEQPIYIYKRADVLKCRSAQTWYRQCRIVKYGEQPLIHKVQKNKITQENEEIGLYHFDQTEQFVPKPVVNGIVPKSKFKTIDVFVNEMIPKGAVHIKDKNAQRAAKLLKIDYANAVVNIEFGKRGPNSQYNGVVVASEYAEAMVAVLLEYRRIEVMEGEYMERQRLLMIWRKIILGIQIWERIERMNPSESAHNAHESAHESAHNAHESEHESTHESENESENAHESEQYESSYESESSHYTESSDEDYTE